MANVDSSDTPTPMSSNPNSAASVQEAPEIRTRRKTDAAWGYCTQFTEDGRKKIKCMYCGSIFSGGGIHRFKEHLAKYPGNVTACSKVDPEVEHTMYQHIEDGNAKKRKAQKDFEKEHPYGPEPGEKEEESAVEVSNTSVVAAAPTRRAAAVNRGRKRGTTTPNIGKYFKPRTNPGDQPTIKSVLQGEAVKLKTDLCVAKWFIDASIPFNASNSIFYQPMIDAVCAYGSGYKGPNFNQLRGSLLAKCVEETKNYVDGYRKTWRETGCTVTADGWTDRKRRTLINFLVYCPKGIIFLKTVDATDSSKTADFLFKLFKDVINFVGPDNVVHFVTDNASNMVAARKRLEDEFPSIYWSPCAAHCLNLILSDFGKEDIVKTTVAHASSITKYIYNHCYPLYLMRKFTKGHEILRPAQTRFATNFVALQSIYKHKNDLHTMVVSNEWTTCAYYKEPQGRKYSGKDLALRSSLTREMRIFRKAEGDFGRSTAKNDRQHMLADEWWQTYGCSAPHLQKLALRVLSQTCSASGCERNWSLFEHVHSKKRNRFEHQRLNDIVYVHNNLRLHQRSKRYTRNYDPISLEEIGKGNKEWIVEDNPPRLNSEELNAFRTELAELSIHCSDELVLNLDDVEANVIRSSD